ncbi:hypothetical protein HID58_060376 [Brassica napus]|uniref:Uncharacterized protein n=1 Tax=Brassica napus TaxID=3708 RepID=A0ABQ7ZVI9_BRANA|nr:hypothetical protein HID58_060376 [Brassica napus]
MGCSKLRKFPDMSTNIRKLDISKTAVEDVPASIAMWFSLYVEQWKAQGDYTSSHECTVGERKLFWDREDARLLHESSSSDCMKALHQLQKTRIIATAPWFTQQPTVFPYETHTPDAVLSFINNFKLSQQARGEIIIGLLLGGSALLPGREVPAKFHHHRARGSSLTIPHSAFSTSKVCLVISPNPKKNREYMTSQLLCCRIFGKDDLYVPLLRR